MTTLSLRKRLLIAAAVILLTFLGLAGVALDRAFISSAEVSLKNQLRTQTFALLSVLEVNQDGSVLIPRQLPEARLMVPNSGLYAFIIDSENNLIWQSGSSLGVRMAGLKKEQLGTETFVQTGTQLSSPFRYSFSVSWETESSVEYEFTLVMIEASDHFVTFVAEHRQKIVLWLGLVGVFLLLLQMAALNWSLSPLVKVSNELDQIEHARQDRILGTYPNEIAQLSERINLFIANERKNLERYRNTLGDLAHSLKTPLAVVKGLAESNGRIDPDELNRYVDRMSNIVEYQLKRAAASRISLVKDLVDVEEVFSRIVESLRKVYAAKEIQLHGDVSPALQFYGDQSDLYELVGNIMDNACKWAQSQIRYTVKPVRGEKGGIRGIRILIEDDGPGVANDVRDLVMHRGIRADQQVNGYGIGLAVSREIVDRYDGDIKIAQSDLGGAAINIDLKHSAELEPTTG